ncbi:neprilysin-1-like [Haemaphysalis longicornis]
MEWLKTAKNRSNTTLNEFFKNYLGDYDKTIDVTKYQKLITAAENKLWTYIEGLDKSGKTRPFSNRNWKVNTLGDATKSFISSADWERLFLKYANYEGSHLVVIWDNAPLVLEHMIDSKGIGPKDSRLLMGWSLLRRLMPFASGRLMAKLYAPKIEELCFKTVSGVMEVAILKLLFDKYATESTVQKVMRMAKLVLGQLKSKLQNSWMKGDMLKQAVDKAAHMGLAVVYPPNFRVPGAIEAFFAEFPVIGSTFFDAYVESHLLATKLIFKERTYRNFTTGVVNAFYSTGQNTFTLLAGMLLPPLFYQNGVSAVNYGALGQIIGHEIMHGYDVRGIKNTYDGYIREPTDASSVKKYNEKVLCLRASYDKAEAERQAEPDPKTDSEGFADWTGVQLAYFAFRSLPAAERDAVIPGLPLDAEKLFFIAHCYKWCGHERKRNPDPKELYWSTRSRCIVPLRHMPEFATAFSCPRGSRMNPAAKCTFFSSS